MTGWFLVWYLKQILSYLTGPSLSCCSAWNVPQCSFGCSCCVLLVGFLHSFSKWFCHPHAAHFFPKSRHLLESCVVPRYWHLLWVLVPLVCELLTISLLCLAHVTMLPPSWLVLLLFLHLWLFGWWPVCHDLLVCHFCISYIFSPSLPCWDCLILPIWDFSFAFYTM